MRTQTHTGWYVASSGESQRSSLGVSYAEHDRHRLVEHYFIAGICSPLLLTPFFFLPPSFHSLHPVFAPQLLSLQFCLFFLCILGCYLLPVLNSSSPSSSLLAPRFSHALKGFTSLFGCTSGLCAARALLHLFIFLSRFHLLPFGSAASHYFFFSCS